MQGKDEVRVRPPYPTLMGIVPLRKVRHNMDYAESWFDSTYPHYRSVRELAQHAGLEPVVCGFDSHQTDCSMFIEHTTAALTFVSRSRLENVAL